MENQLNCVIYNNLIVVCTVNKDLKLMFQNILIIGLTVSKLEILLHYCPANGSFMHQLWKCEDFYRFLPVIALRKAVEDFYYLAVRRQRIWNHHLAAIQLRIVDTLEVTKAGMFHNQKL